MESYNERHNSSCAINYCTSISTMLVISLVYLYIHLSCPRDRCLFGRSVVFGYLLVRSFSRSFFRELSRRVVI